MESSRNRIVLIAAVAVACAALVPIVIASRPSTSSGRPEPVEGRGADPAPRDVRIVVRDMAFYVDGQETPNPTLRFKAGEKIRLVLRNEDGGMNHDLVISDWDVATRTLNERGQEDTVLFRVPRRGSTSGYKCTPHPQMMQGSIQVD